jgi:predicted DNA-binding transcriptional regulator YafY
VFIPSRVIDRYGYRSLPTLFFEPDELAAVTDAAARVRHLGDPLLAPLYARPARGAVTRALEPVRLLFVGSVRGVGGERERRLGA